MEVEAPETLSVTISSVIPSEYIEITTLTGTIEIIDDDGKLQQICAVYLKLPCLFFLL